MMEDSCLPDIETAGGAEAQQLEQRQKPNRKYATITVGVALGALIAIGVVIGTRQPDGGVSDGAQAAFLTLGENETMIPTSAPPDLQTDPTSSECIINGVCSEKGALCAIGKESCCGETFDSIACECSGEEWLCRATDACMRPDCGDLITTAPSAALASCDYSTPDKTCSTDDDCTCGDVCLASPFDDFSVCGCEVDTTNGCDPNSNKPFCYQGFTVSGVDCGCRDNDDCEDDETCGTSWCFVEIVPYCSIDHNALCPPTPSPVNSFIPPETSSPTTVNDIAEDPTPAPTPEPTEIVTTIDTPQPTEAVTAPPTNEPTKAVTETPTEAVTTAVTAAATTAPTPEPTEAVTTAITTAVTAAVTTAVTIAPTPEPTEAMTSAITTAPTATVTAAVTGSVTSHATDEFPLPGPTYCVNIKFTSNNYPGDNGFTFQSTKSGEVLYAERPGFMTEPKTEYLRKFCDLSVGSYTLVVTDKYSDGMFAEGNGSYVVDIDGQVILVGGRFRTEEISHEILVGVEAIMSEADQGFLDAHNSRRQVFHESQGVSFRPMAWSAELAAGASAWAKEKAKTCTTDGRVSGNYGQNSASQRLVRRDLAHTPDEIVSWWTNKFDPEQTSLGIDLKPGSAVMWRTALYVGCAAEIAPIEDCPETQRACFCQVTNCRYSRTTNCAVDKNNWVDSVIGDNGSMCDTVFCPGADENGTIVEGACHV